jgi:hypothetical protein
LQAGTLEIGKEQEHHIQNPTKYKYLLRQ